MSSERQLLEQESPWWGEHVHRYQEACRLVGEHDVVLDIACGTGFGTAMLADRSDGRVLGGDVDTEAIATSQSVWHRPNLEFRVMDATRLEFPDAHFDAIVSFETLEHTRQYREMLAELDRVLKPGGRLILSTPNRLVSSPSGRIVNPYHTQEFDPDELLGLLRERFPRVALRGQCYVRYAGTAPVPALECAVERLLLARGIRRLPYRARNQIMQRLWKVPLYPRVEDFAFVEDLAQIRSRCPVQVALCHKETAHG